MVRFLSRAATHARNELQAVFVATHCTVGLGWLGVLAGLNYQLPLWLPAAVGCTHGAHIHPYMPVCRHFLSVDI